MLAGIALSAPRSSMAADNAQTLLTAAATATGQLNSFHFVISFDQGKIEVLDKLELVKAEGDVQRPSSLSVTVSGKIKILPVTASVIIIGEDVWASVTSKNDRFEKVDLEALDKLQLSTEFDPTSLLLKAIDHVDNPTITGSEDIAGASTTIVEGTVDLSKIETDSSRGTLATAPVAVKVWIDGDNLVRRLQIIGPLLQGEPDAIVHQLDLSGFNEQVDIVAPAE